MVTKVKIYVGCALTEATEDFKKEVEDLKADLRQAGYEVFDFIGLVDGTPRGVYEWDLGRCVGECDIFVAICDLPSTGLGMEIGRAIQLKKPVLAAAHADAKVTRMVLGAAEVEGTMQFVRYAQLRNLQEHIVRIAATL